MSESPSDSATPFAVRYNYISLLFHNHANCQLQSPCKKRWRAKRWKFEQYGKVKFTLMPYLSIKPLYHASGFFSLEMLSCNAPSSHLRNSHTTSCFTQTSQQTWRAGKHCDLFHRQGNGERLNSVPLRSQCCSLQKHRLQTLIAPKKLIYVLPASVPPVSWCYWITYRCIPV